MTRITIQDGGVYSTMTRNERAPGNGYSRHAYDAMHAQCEWGQFVRLDSKSKTVWRRQRRI